MTSNYLYVLQGKVGTYLGTVDKSSPVVEILWLLPNKVFAKFRSTNRRDLCNSVLDTP